VILLRDLLAEITLGSTTPYATQFVWTESADDAYETDVDCDGVTVKFHLQGNQPGEYAFAIVTKMGVSGWTVTHGRSAIRGQLSYLRILRTAMEALLDFCSQHAPQAIDITGFDSSADKDLQKTRIYRDIAQANSAQLRAIGYLVFYRNGRLWLVRSHDADATGIESESR
jgi:hypothetical protein